MFWFFKKNKINEIKEETKKGFESVKKDILSVGDWIKHLDSEKKDHKKEINTLKDEISTIKKDIQELKEAFSFFADLNTNNHSNRPFKTSKSLFNKQTAVYPVQTGVQTGVQTPNLNNFSVTERAILFILLNADIKLSYEDLATMLNKEKSTIRGQINAIKSKSETLIEESVEKNGKKRLYIPQEIKEKILKKQKVSVKEKKETEKKGEKKEKEG